MESKQEWTVVARPAPFVGSLVLLVSFLIFGLNFTQVFAQVASVKHQPLEVTLLIDVSGSTKGERIARARESIAVVLSILPDDTRMTLSTFNHDTVNVVNRIALTAASRATIFGQLEKINSAGATDMLKAAGTAIQNSSDQGIVIMLGDGEQAPRGDTVPEAEWRDQLTELTRRAAAKQVRFFAIALGEDADRTFLTRIAVETGGEFYAVAQPGDLLKSFTALASQFGRFMYRTQPGEFSITGRQDVIAVFQTRDNPDGFLTKEEAGSHHSVLPSVTLRFDSILAVRFDLPTGRYRFDPPEGVEYTSLLRPMPFKWSPLQFQVEAARRNEVIARVTADSPGISFDGLKLIAIRPEPVEALEGIASTQGDVHLPLFFPADASGRRNVWPLKIEQHGWHYSMNEKMQVDVVPPADVDVRVTAAGGNRLPTELNIRTVTGDTSGLEHTLPLETLVRTRGLTGSLEFSVPADSGVRLATKDVATVHHEVRKHSVTLQLTNLGVPRVVRTSLQIRVRSSDPARWTVNGEDAVTIPVQWQILPPPDVDVRITAVDGTELPAELTFETIAGDESGMEQALELASFVRTEGRKGTLEICIPEGSELELKSPAPVAVLSRTTSHSIPIRLKNNLSARVVSASLQVRARSSDSARWTVNGQDSMTIPVRWRVVQPAVSLDVPDIIQLGTIQRGTSTSTEFAFATSGLNHLTGSPVEAVLKAEMPDGVRLICACQTADIRSRPTEGGIHYLPLKAASERSVVYWRLNLETASVVLPGLYRIPVSVTLSDPRASLNGKTARAETLLELNVAAVRVQAAFARAAGDVQSVDETSRNVHQHRVREILEGESFEMNVDVTTVDGGILPEIIPVWAGAHDDVHIHLAGRDSERPDHARLRFRVDVPPRCRPGIMTAILDVTGEISLTRRPSLVVQIPGVVIDPRPEPVAPEQIPLHVREFTLVRYDSRLEPYFGWIRRHDLQLQLEITNRQLWDRLKAEWSLTATNSCMQTVDVLSSGQDGSFIATIPLKLRSSDLNWNLKIETAWQFARLAGDPAGREDSTFDIRLVPTVRVIPLPFWLKALLTVASALLTLGPLIWRYRPFSVLLKGRPHRHRFCSMRVTRGVWLWRPWLGELHISRRQPAGSGQIEICIDRADPGSTPEVMELGPDRSTAPLYPGDLVRVTTPDGESSTIEVTRAPRRRERASFDNPLDRQDTPKDISFPDLSALGR